MILFQDLQWDWGKKKTKTIFNNQTLWKCSMKCVDRSSQKFWHSLLWMKKCPNLTIYTVIIHLYINMYRRTIYCNLHMNCFSAYLFLSDSNKKRKDHFWHILQHEKERDRLATNKQKSKKINKVRHHGCDSALHFHHLYKN